MHKMRLNSNSFQKIVSRKKTIEMRLYDEKRSYIRQGDLVEFACEELRLKMLCKVLKIYKYNNFEELYLNHDKISLGYDDNEEANPKDMEAIYSKENIEKYGVLGIELKFLSSFKM